MAPITVKTADQTNLTNTPIRDIPLQKQTGPRFGRELFDGTRLYANAGTARVVSITDTTPMTAPIYTMGDTIETGFYNQREIVVEFDATHYMGRPDTRMTREILHNEMRSLAATVINQGIPQTYAYTSAIQDIIWDQTTATTSAIPIQNVRYATAGQITATHTIIDTITANADGSTTITVRAQVPLNAMYGMEAVHATEESKKAAFQHRIRREIKNNLLIKISKKTQGREALPAALASPEQKARETLRDMITESDWRRYVTNGFIMVKAPSGLWYQVFNRYSERMRVYKDGKHIETICIHTDTSCPPTDHVLSMKILIELDEESVRKGGNLHQITPLQRKMTDDARETLAQVQADPAHGERLRQAMRNHLRSHGLPIVDEETPLDEVERLVREGVIEPWYAANLRVKLGYKNGTIKPQPTKLMKICAEEKLRIA